MLPGNYNNTKDAYLWIFANYSIVDYEIKKEVDRIITILFHASKLIFYIDDLLLVHVGLAIVTEYIEMLDSIYGSMDLLSVI